MATVTARRVYVPTEGWDAYVGGDLLVDGGNVGAGVYQGRAFPTTTIATGGGVTYDAVTKAYTIAAGVTIEDQEIPGFVILGPGARLLNCHVIGPAAEVTVGRAMVRGTSTGYTGSTAFVDFCTIDPEVTSSYYDGLGPVNLAVTRSVVKNATDGVRAFDYLAANGGRCNLYLESVKVYSLAQQIPDVAGGRDMTHSDGIQLQGNPSGSATDVHLKWCDINARHSTTKGYQPATNEYLSAVMLSPNVGAIRATFTECVLSGAPNLHVINSLAGSLSSTSSLAIVDSRIERPGWLGAGSTADPVVAWSVNAAGTLVTTNTGNTFLDNGSAVSITYV